MVEIIPTRVVIGIEFEEFSVCPSYIPEDVYEYNEMLPWLYSDPHEAIKKLKEHADMYMEEAPLFYLCEDTLEKDGAIDAIDGVYRLRTKDDTNQYYSCDHIERVYRLIPFTFYDRGEKQ